MPHSKGLSTLDDALSDPGFINIDIPGKPELNQKFQDLAPVRAEKRQTNIARKTLQDLLGEASKAGKLVKSLSGLSGPIKEAFIPEVFRKPDTTTKPQGFPAGLALSVGQPQFRSTLKAHLENATGAGAQTFSREDVVALLNADRQARNTQNVQEERTRRANRNPFQEKVDNFIEAIEDTTGEEVSPELEKALIDFLITKLPGTGLEATLGTTGPEEKEGELTEAAKKVAVDVTPSKVLPQAGEPLLGGEEAEAKAKSSEPRVLDEPTARALLDEVGGDKKKARALAKERGFTF